MSDKTHIEWTNATWNPVTGCTKVSAGCKHCYAERDWARLSANPATRYYGRAFTDVQCHSDVLELPLRWTKPRRIFVNSMSDLFHPDVPDQFIADVFAYMAYARHHTFQVLTKRPERMRALLTNHEWIEEMYSASTALAHDDACEILGRRGAFDANRRTGTDIRAFDPTFSLSNVWLGVSVEDQATADERIPLLLQTPAAVRWISAEPLLGPMNLAQIRDADVLLFPLAGEVSGEGRNEPMPLRNGGIDWVVAGGESGPKARPMHPNWARSLRDQCAAAGVSFLFKQWGEFLPIPDAEDRGLIASGLNPVRSAMMRVGKKTAGRLLDGILHDGYPEARS